MTFAGWLQILFVLVVSAGAAWALGRLHGALVRGQAHHPFARARPRRSRLLPPRRLSTGPEQGWLAYTLAMLAFNAAGFLLLYALLRLQGSLPLNPQGFDGAGRSRLQHGRQLRHQHQLAGLWRRNHDEPFQSDGRARRCRTSCRRPPASRSRLRFTRAFARSRASRRSAISGSI